MGYADLNWNPLVNYTTLSKSSGSTVMQCTALPLFTGQTMTSHAPHCKIHSWQSIVKERTKREVVEFFRVCYVAQNISWLKHFCEQCSEKWHNDNMSLGFIRIHLSDLQGGESRCFVQCGFELQTERREILIGFCCNKGFSHADNHWWLCVQCILNG